MSMRNRIYKARFHRFHDTAAFDLTYMAAARAGGEDSSGDAEGTETVYADAVTARAIAYELLRLARDIEHKPFVASQYGSITLICPGDTRPDRIKATARAEGEGGE